MSEKQRIDPIRGLGCKVWAIYLNEAARAETQGHVAPPNVIVITPVDALNSRYRNPSVVSACRRIMRGFRPLRHRGQHIDGSAGETRLQSRPTAGPEGGLAPFKLDLALLLIHGDFEVAHEGHTQ
jgi:hypothetical protein